MSEQGGAPQPPQRCAIDEHSNQETVERGLAGLRKMVELGRLAEQALKEIQAKGSTFIKCPVAGERYGGFSRETEFPEGITWHRFPPLLPVSRADIPGFGTFKVQLGEAKAAEYSGHPCREVPVTVRLAGVKQVNWNKHDPCTVECHPGKFRINKNHISFVDQNGSAYRLYKSMKVSPEAAKSAEGIARRLEFVVVGEKKKPSQKTVDLKAQVNDWFIQDGFHVPLMEELWRLAQVVDVMST